MKTILVLVTSLATELSLDFLTSIKCTFTILPLQVIFKTKTVKTHYDYSLLCNGKNNNTENRGNKANVYVNSYIVRSIKYLSVQNA